MESFWNHSVIEQYVTHVSDFNVQSHNGIPEDFINLNLIRHIPPPPPPRGGGGGGGGGGVASISQRYATHFTQCM